MKRVACASLIVSGIILSSQSTGSAQRTPVIQVQASTARDLRDWDTYVTQRERSGELRVRTVDRDPALPSRTIERLQQFHRGVPIWGAEVVRDSERGVPLSMFGVLSPDLTLSVNPSLSPGEARDALLGTGRGDAILLQEAELVILRMDSGEHRLAYTAVVSAEGDVFRVFVDAGTGREFQRYNEIQTQAAVGTGRGVLGDTKKLSVLSRSGAYATEDQHRPPVLVTFDMRGSLTRAQFVIERRFPLFTSDVASDGDNTWTDPAVVDAHVHVGWTYDYYYKRHGRRGLDDADRPISIVTNAVTQQQALAYPPTSDIAEVYVLNAFWCGICGPSGNGLLFFGNGIPDGFYHPEWLQHVTYLAGSLDIAAHELTHAVTDSSSRLIYQGESGALNEAFSDIMGASAEFFYQSPGNNPGQADYVIGEDSFRGVFASVPDGIRSMSSPTTFGHPDHYSRYVRLPLSADGDWGGIHINSGIPNQAFYLSIEGGTNSTSRATVQGVGAANREQIEKVYYRAFVFLLPPNATFSTARAATVRAAQDLYGVGGAVERAVTQAWTAVGVF